MNEKCIDMPELYLNNENYDEKIGETIVRSHFILQFYEHEIINYYKGEYPFKYELIGFPVPIDLLLEYYAKTNIPTTSFDIAKGVFMNIMKSEYPISIVEKGTTTMAYEHLNIEKIIKTGSKEVIMIMNHFIEKRLENSIYKGNIDDIVEFVKRIQPYIRKNVFENSSALCSFKVYLKLLGKEGC